MKKTHNPKTLVIIGSGIAGITSAIRLKSAGNVVTVFETNSYPGGKQATYLYK